MVFGEATPLNPRRDVLGQLLHVLRLPDLDAADGTEADHDVVCLGIVFHNWGGEIWKMLGETIELPGGGFKY